VELDAKFECHSIDHFASVRNTLLPGYNAVWQAPTKPDGKTRHSSRWPKSNLSTSPAQTRPNLGGGRYAVQQKVLTWPSQYSVSPPGIALLKTRSLERYICTIYGTTPRPHTSRPSTRPDFQVKVQSQRHCQHQPVDRDDETVHDQDPRFGHTRREDPSPPLRIMGP
jgi:hypothetical protein